MYLAMARIYGRSSEAVNSVSLSLCLSLALSLSRSLSLSLSLSLCVCPSLFYTHSGGSRGSGRCTWSDSPCDYGAYFKPGPTYNGPPAGV